MNITILATLGATNGHIRVINGEALLEAYTVRARDLCIRRNQIAETWSEAEGVDSVYSPDLPVDSVTYRGAQ